MPGDRLGAAASRGTPRGCVAEATLELFERVHELRAICTEPDECVLEPAFSLGGQPEEEDAAVVGGGFTPDQTGLLRPPNELADCGLVERQLLGELGRRSRFALPGPDREQQVVPLGRQSRLCSDDSGAGNEPSQRRAKRRRALYLGTAQHSARILG